MLPQLHSLFILGILMFNFQANAMDGEASDREALAIERFFEKDLLTLVTHYPSKHWIEDPTYAGASGMYATAGAPLNYPKIPRVHSYDHSAQETYFSLQLPQEILSFTRQEDLNQLFSGTEIPKENIRVFFMAQNNLDDNILFRPHYFTDPTITTAQYSTATPVSVRVSPLAGFPITLNSSDNSFVTAGISCHPGQGGIIASPANFQLKGLEINAESIFYSATIIPSQRKAALTFHHTVGEMPTDEFLYTVDAASKVRDLMSLPLFIDTFDTGFSGFICQLASSKS